MLSNKVKALIFGFLFSITYSILGVSSKCENISDKVLRLHIIANSNSKEDQNLKLKVRDRILSEFSDKLSMKNNIEEVKKEIEKNISQIKFIAQNEVHNNGFDYKIDVEVVNMYFNTRQYNNTTMPSGFYDALRITLGEGKGKNWWCVMFPPICLAATEQKSNLEDVLNPAEMDIVQNNSEYSLKLKIVEIIVGISNFLSIIYEKLSDYSNSVFEEIDEHYEVGFKTPELISNMDVFK